MIPHTTSQLIDSLRAYLDVPIEDTKGNYEMCGPIQYSPIEQHYMDKELKKNGYKKPPCGKGSKYCEYLTKEGACSVYNERPIICRAYGVVNDGGLTDAPLCTKKPLYTPKLMEQYVPHLTTGNKLYKKTFKKIIEEYLSIKSTSL